MSGIEAVIELTRRLGIARSVDFTKVGIHRQYVMLASRASQIERLGRGMYRLPGLPEHAHSHLIGICKRHPRGVLCLHSALFFHQLIETQPDQLWIAIDRNEWAPKATPLSLRFVRFSEDAMTQGVVSRTLGGVPLRIYSPMKNPITD